MRVQVDDERCKGHGVCCALCPSVFELSDDGYAVVKLDVVPVELEEAVESAVDQCPERAISIAQ
jgi:ferredoxin